MVAQVPQRTSRVGAARMLAGSEKQVRARVVTCRVDRTDTLKKVWPQELCGGVMIA
jgi:hypothetical protein